MLVTIGQHAADYARELFHADKYQEYLYWHGLNAEGAEGLAEFVHKRIRVELGFGTEDAREIDELIKQNYRGSRYSFGYPAVPKLADQRMILDLLGADSDRRRDGRRRPAVARRFDQRAGVATIRTRNISPCDRLR